MHEIPKSYITIWQKVSRYGPGASMNCLPSSEPQLFARLRVQLCCRPLRVQAFDAFGRTNRHMELRALAWIIHDFASEKRKGALKD
jgi:hypothetical protein